MGFGIVSPKENKTGGTVLLGGPYIGFQLITPVLDPDPERIGKVGGKPFGSHEWCWLEGVAPGMSDWIQQKTHSTRQGRFDPLPLEPSWPDS